MRIRRTPLTITTGLATTALIAAGATDLTLEHTAQQRVVRVASCRLHATGSVTAELTDTLAGLEVLNGDLGTVHVTADGVQRAGTSMNIDAVLHNVTTHGATDGGTATATVPYSALQQRMGPAVAGMTIGTDATGLTLTGNLGGMGLPVTIETTISTAGNSLVVTPTNVVVFGQAIPVGSLSSMSAGSGMTGSLQPHTVALPSLPAGATLDSARPTSAGLSLLLSIPKTTGLAKSTGTSAAGSTCSTVKA
jgi:hypothetical protein